MNRLLILLALLPFSILFMLGWSLYVMGGNPKKDNEAKSNLLEVRNRLDPSEGLKECTEEVVEV